MARAARLLLLLVPFWLAGCDMLGIESASVIAARKEADSKAIGAACRHAGRAIEDCYNLNKRADKAAVFAGWREMNDYMAENKIEAVTPSLATPEMTAGADIDDDPPRKAAKGQGRHGG